MVPPPPYVNEGLITGSPDYIEIYTKNESLLTPITTSDGSVFYRKPSQYRIFDHGNRDPSLNINLDSLCRTINRISKI
jgi:hypothetical protein